jgi:MOSC domain-containing protein YiiM
MELLDSAEVSRETGVANDSRGRPGKRQITLLSADTWQTICSELGADIPWTMRRSNLLVEDMELPRRAGDIIEIGSVRLKVRVEVDPCSRMDEQFEGLTDALRPGWRGGVGCEVLTGGRLALGDPVSVQVID